jgi:glycosyltransferase involved in cell wall biosynthesis
MIPAFNRRDLIERTVRSVLCQTHVDIDVVLVDDASTDGTAEASANFAHDERFSIVRNFRNLGLTANWNRCLELARGPLIQVMQSDDLIDEDYLARVNEIFEKYADVGFVAANCRAIDATDRVLDEGRSTQPHLFPRGDDAIRAILSGGYPHVSSIVVRKRAIDAVGGFDPADWFAPDLNMDTKLAQNFDFYHLGGVHTSFRKHGTNSGVTEFLRSDYLDTYARLLRSAWGRLSTGALNNLGIVDLGRHVDSHVASMALAAAAWTTAYGFRTHARVYLRKAVTLNPKLLTSFSYWRLRGVALSGPLGAWAARTRLRVTAADLERARRIEREFSNRGLSLSCSGFGINW